MTERPRTTIAKSRRNESTRADFVLQRASEVSLSRKEWAQRLAAAWKKNDDLRAELVRDTVEFGRLLQRDNLRERPAMVSGEKYSPLGLSSVHPNQRKQGLPNGSGLDLSPNEAER